MIATRLVKTTAYRVFVPRWAYAPTSGEGAAKHGGRVNRPGLEALYLSLDPETAVKEYQQVSTLLVIYPTLFDENDSIAVHDPKNALPKNQDSWE